MLQQLPLSGTSLFSFMFGIWKLYIFVLFFKFTPTPRTLPLWPCSTLYSVPSEGKGIHWLSGSKKQGKWWCNNSNSASSFDCLYFLRCLHTGLHFVATSFCPCCCIQVDCFICFHCHHRCHCLKFWSVTLLPQCIQQHCHHHKTSNDAQPNSFQILHLGQCNDA